MLPENRRDLGTGVVLLLLGLWIATYALAHYRLGEMSRIGAAVYPAGVGLLLAALGLIIAGSAWFRAGPSDRAPLRPIVMVLGAIMAFALLVDRAGLFPAVAVLVGGAILADRQHSWRSGILLTLLAAVGVWVIFGLVLGMSFTILRWPL